MPSFTNLVYMLQCNGFKTIGMLMTQKTGLLTHIIQSLLLRILVFNFPWSFSGRDGHLYSSCASVVVLLPVPLLRRNEFYSMTKRYVSFLCSIYNKYFSQLIHVALNDTDLVVLTVYWHNYMTAKREV
jgi:hypothetical protein